MDRIPAGSPADRPTLAAWLGKYDEIYEEYLSKLASSGVRFADRDEPGSLAELRGRLAAKGALIRNGGASISHGWLSSACEACTGSRCSKSFSISLACPRSCYFCLNANQDDYEEYSERKYDWLAQLARAKEDGLPLTHIGLTGGEPLLYHEDASSFLVEAGRLFPGAHLRLYTAGDLLDEGLLEELRDCGLRELRVSVKLDDGCEAVASTLEKISLAVSIIPDVMVEMPVAPGTAGEMKGLLAKLDFMGVAGVNLLEFCYSLRNRAEYDRRGFAVKIRPFDVLYDYSYAGALPVDRSEDECLELLEFAIDAGLSMGVHYCSLDNKHRSQIRQMNEGVRLPPWYELDGEDFFFKTARVFDGDVPMVRGLLKSEGVGRSDWNEDEGLSFNPSLLDVVMSLPVVPAISYNVVERRGDALKLRELKLEPVTAAQTKSREIDAAGWAVRATAWELAAFAFRYPGDELVEAVSSGEWGEAAEEVMAALGVEPPEGFAADAHASAGEDPATLLHQLRAEATRLFVGAPEPAVSPYEGVWRAADDGVQALLFVNPHSMAVERFCKSCGLGRPQGTNEPLDHAATELELMQHLCMRAAGMVEPSEGAPADEDLPGGSPAAAYEQFLSEHALTWLPRFAEAVARETRLPYYRAAAALLSGLIA